MRRTRLPPISTKLSRTIALAAAVPEAKSSVKILPAEAAPAVTSEADVPQLLQLLDDLCNHDWVSKSCTGDDDIDSLPFRYGHASRLSFVSCNSRLCPEESDCAHLSRITWLISSSPKIFYTVLHRAVAE